MDDYQAYDAVGLAALVRDKTVSAEELLATARARAAEVNGRINAIVVDVEPPAADDSGPFAGVPFLLKDLGQDLAGYPTSGGSRSLSTTPPPSRHRRAALAGRRSGGVRQDQHPGVRRQGRSPSRACSARRATHGTSTTRRAAPPAARPRRCRRDRAVAAASDGGGSIRIPAAACGLFGLKPSRGLVPSGPLVREGWAGPRPTAWSRARCATRRRCSTCSSGRRPTRRTSPALPATPSPTRWARTPGRCASGCAPRARSTPRRTPRRSRRRPGRQLLESLGHHVEELRSRSTTPPWPATSSPRGSRRGGLGRAGQGVQRLR